MNNRLIVAIAAIAINLAAVAPNAQASDRGNTAAKPSSLPCGSRKPTGTAAMPRRWKNCRRDVVDQKSAPDQQAEKTRADGNREI